jgi:hypothetical protein
MQVGVEFADERVDLEVADDRLVGAWSAPEASRPGPARPRVREALEGPRDYPPLRSAVVPGDRVVIPVTPGIPELPEVLQAACEVLGEAGVEPSGITILWPPEAPAPPRDELPEGVTLAVHDPDDRAAMAYLASTSGGRRVYLNRLLTDADFVLPIGRLGFDPVLGFRGPWSALYPAQSDTETRREFAAMASDARPDPDRERPALAEVAEVGWLLGSLFQLGIAADRHGAGAIEAGRESTVRREGSRGVADTWTVHAPGTADLVVAGIGGRGLDDLAAGLAAATRLVRPGGRIVMLSRAAGEPGPALGHLTTLDEHDLGPAALKAHRDGPDYTAARRMAEALVRADVYLLSDLDPQLVEDLGMIPLSRPDEARRLAAGAASVFVLEAAESVRVELDEA